MSKLALLPVSSTLHLEVNLNEVAKKYQLTEDNLSFLNNCIFSYFEEGAQDLMFFDEELQEEVVIGTIEIVDATIEEANFYLMEY